MLTLMQEHATLSYDQSKRDKNFATNYNGNMIGCLIVLMVDIFFVRCVGHSSIQRVAGVMPKCMDDAIAIVVALQDGNFARARDFHLPALGKHIRKSRFWHEEVQTDDLIWSASRYAPYKAELVSAMLDRCDEVYVAAWALLAGTQRCQDAEESALIICQVMPRLSVRLNDECVHAVRKTLLEKPGEDSWKQVRASLKHIFRRGTSEQDLLQLGKHIGRRPTTDSIASQPKDIRTRASSDLSGDLHKGLARSRTGSAPSSRRLQRLGSIASDGLDGLQESEDVSLWQLLGRQETAGDASPVVTDRNEEDMPLRLLTARSRSHLGAVEGPPLSIKEVLQLGSAINASAFNAALTESGSTATAALVKTATWAVALRANTSALLRAVQSIEVLLQEHIFWAAEEWRPRIRSRFNTDPVSQGQDSESESDDEMDQSDSVGLCHTPP